MYITPQELLDRYNAGERNFAGIRFFPDTCRETVLEDADLSNIMLSGAYLPRIKLSLANLRNSNLTGAYMRGAELIETDLYETDLTGANLQDACLSGTDIARSLLIAANLRGAELEGADFTDVDLSESILCQVDFSQTVNRFESRFIYCPYAWLWQMTMPDGTYIEGPQYDYRF
ncbi:MAG: pentapeptide repeat-containing protein [Okeania sp. SIO3C4]|nr:pentapeptide repeat-containing protein [Okeania sp. SIO3B3]NER07283.1 pentapeptide repeat-containing protein [Okeania sp. SIO3C4]